MTWFLLIGLIFVNSYLSVFFVEAYIHVAKIIQFYQTTQGFLDNF